jgi:glycerol-3-phosphate dehydrogenase (NAD(P)+)
MLITLALGEFSRLADAMGYTDYDIMSPGVIGDLMLTCSSDQSRNYRFGLSMAKSDQEEMARLLNATVEGYHTSHSIRYIARQKKIDLPLALLTLRIINDTKNGPAHFHKLIADC